MSEPSPMDRVLMLFRTIASLVTWVAALGFGFIRGKVQATSDKS